MLFRRGLAGLASGLGMSTVVSVTKCSNVVEVSGQGAPNRISDIDETERPSAEGEQNIRVLKEGISTLPAQQRTVGGRAADGETLHDGTHTSSAQTTVDSL